MKKNVYIFLHLLGWGLYVGFLVYAIGLRIGFAYFVTYVCTHLPVNMGVFYLNYLYFIPKLLRQEKLVKFFFCNLFILATLPVIDAELDHWISRLHHGVPFISLQVSYNQQILLRIIILGLLIGLANVVRFSFDWFSNEQQQKELQTQQLSTELAFLKTQVNPHFLFNVLNSIYALSIKQSPQTPDAVMKLSQLMRYMLYESNGHRVYLIKEMENMGHYIDLQRLRLPAHALITFDIEGIMGDRLIEPLLLMTLVENAFKHGATGWDTTTIRIKLEVTSKDLTLTTINGIRKVKSIEYGGIGLQNVRRRLELLYPGKHSLELRETGEMFYATLQLSC